MFDVYPSNWPIAFDPGDPRNEFHETALREARVATDARIHPTESPVTARFMTRLRLAFSGGATAADTCNCPA